jgi:hypothetical protein
MAAVKQANLPVNEQLTLYKNVNNVPVAAPRPQYGQGDDG